MRKFSLILLALGIAGILLPAAWAQTTITYTTEGEFNGMCNGVSGYGTGCVDVFPSMSGTDTITFDGITTPTSVDVNPPPFSNLSLGSFYTAGAGTLEGLSGTFSLEIFQTSPSSGMNTLSGTISGELDYNSSTGMVTFVPDSTTIGGETYTLTSSGIVPLVAPSSGGGMSSIAATVTAAAVPEPATTGIIGGALALMGLVVRRRSAKKA